MSKSPVHFLFYLIKTLLFTDIFKEESNVYNKQEFFSPIIQHPLLINKLAITVKIPLCPEIA